MNVIFKEIEQALINIKRQQHLISTGNFRDKKTDKLCIEMIDENVNIIQNMVRKLELPFKKTQITIRAILNTENEILQDQNEKISPIYPVNEARRVVRDKVNRGYVGVFERLLEKQCIIEKTLLKLKRGDFQLNKGFIFWLNHENENPEQYKIMKTGIADFDGHIVYYIYLEQIY